LPTINSRPMTKSASSTGPNQRGLCLTLFGIGAV
jgi:hypothetical protein